MGIYSLFQLDEVQNLGLMGVGCGVWGVGNGEWGIGGLGNWADDVPHLHEKCYI